MSGFRIVSQSVLIGRDVGCEPGAQVGLSIYPKYAFSLKFYSLASLKEVETSHLTSDLFTHQKISNILTKEFTDRFKKEKT